jgi:hypothetical protein
MSTELKSRVNGVALTRFFGGADRGTCVQVTVDKGAGQFEFVQLTRAQAEALSADLLDFSQGREVEDDD